MRSAVVVALSLLLAGTVAIPPTPQKSLERTVTPLLQRTSPYHLVRSLKSEVPNLTTMEFIVTARLTLPTPPDHQIALTLRQSTGHTSKVKLKSEKRRNKETRTSLLRLNQFMDGLAADESDNDYSYFSRGPDGRSGTGDDLLGRFSIRRYNWENWSVDTFGKVLNWQNHQTQDAVATHILRNLFTRYRLAFPGETYTQTYQRLAAWWKLPSRANDIHPRQTWSIGLKSYVYKVGQKTNNLGYDGWGHEGHLS